MGKIEQKRFHPDQEEFIKIYTELKNGRRVGEYYDVNTKTITEYAKEIGFKNMYLINITKEDIEFICDNYNKFTAKELGEKFKCSTSNISKIWTNHNLIGKFNYSYKFDENYFENVDTIDKAYFLGLLASDGCVYNRKNGQKGIRLSLQKSDYKIIEIFIEKMKCNKPILYFKNTASIEINSDKMAFDLSKFKIVPNKTYLDVIPNLPDEYMRNFIRGYFDGDGCISFKKNLHDIGTSIAGYEFNLKQISKFLENKNIFMYFTEDKRQYNEGNGRFGSLFCSNKLNKYCFLNYIYYNKENIFMERKFETSKRFFDIIESENQPAHKEILVYYKYAVKPFLLNE